MADRNIIRHIYSSSVPYITTLDDYPYQWVFESIRIHHAVVGYICVRGTVREFTEDDLEFIDVFSKMLSIEMQKDSAYRHPTGLRYEYFLTELLKAILTGRVHFRPPDPAWTHPDALLHSPASYIHGSVAQAAAVQRIF